MRANGVSLRRAASCFRRSVEAAQNDGTISSSLPRKIHHLPQGKKSLLYTVHYNWIYELQQRFQHGLLCHGPCIYRGIFKIFPSLCLAPTLRNEGVRLSNCIRLSVTFFFFIALMAAVSRSWILKQIWSQLSKCIHGTPRSRKLSSMRPSPLTPMIRHWLAVLVIHHISIVSSNPQQ